MGFSRQEYWSGLPFPSPVDHTVCQTCPPWPTRLGWPHRAWLSFIGLDQAVVCVIRLTSFLWLWFHCVCLLMPSWNTYRLTWVSLTLDMGYLFTAAPSKVQPLLLTVRPRGSPHIQGAVAAQVQEGWEEPLHVQGQEGRREQISLVQDPAVSAIRNDVRDGGEIVTPSSVVHSIGHFTKQIGILNQKIPLHINPNYVKSYMKRQNFCSFLRMRTMSPLYSPGKF